MKRQLILMTAAVLLLTAVSCGRDKKSSSVIQPDGDTHEENAAAEVKLAFIGGETGKLSTALAEYDRANKDITLDIHRYDSSDIEYTEAFNQLTRDMLAGDTPDVIIAPPDGMRNLQRSGYLADLTPFMESSETVTPDGLLPNVREAVDCGDTIPYMFPCFSYETYLASTDFIGAENENWSYDAAMEAYRSSPDKEGFPEGPTLWHFFLRQAGRESIDFESGTCDFGGDFLRVIDFLQEYPFDLNDYEYKDSSADHMRSLNIAGISGINLFSASYVYSMYGGEPVTYVGYPSAECEGDFVTVPHLWAVPENSGNKEKGWALIENFLRLSEQKKMSLEYVSGVPVTEEALQALAYDTPSYMAMSARAALTPPDGGDESLYITDEALVKLLDHSRRVKIDLDYGSVLDNMIRNEWLEVMRGEQTADECVESLNNRVGLYLSERE